MTQVHYLNLKYFTKQGYKDLQKEFCEFLKNYRKKHQIEEESLYTRKIRDQLASIALYLEECDESERKDLLNMIKREFKDVL